MIEDLLIHACTIRRPTHTIAGQQKTTGSTTIASGVRCRIQPADNAVEASVLGMSARSSYRAWFPRGTDVRERDLVTWTDRTPALELTVEGVLRLSEMTSSSEHHVAAALVLRVA